MSICFSGSLSLCFISFLVPYTCFVHSWLNKLIDRLSLLARFWRLGFEILKEKIIGKKR